MKRTLELKAPMDDIESGLTDEEIVSKYDLSREALRKGFDNLVRAIAGGGVA